MHVADQHLVVMQSVQCSAGGAGNPGGIGACFGVADLLLQHGFHQIGHRPHAFSDLRFSAQAAGQPDQNVVALIGLDPRAAFHIAFANHGASAHGGMHLVARAVKEAGIDKRNTAAGRCDAGLQVDAGSAFFIHDSQLDGARRQAEHFFYAPKQLVGERHFCWAVHFGLDDVHRAFARVANGIFFSALQIMHGDGGGNNRVQNSLWNLVRFSVSAGVGNGRVGHQVAYVANKHERAAMQSDRLAVCSGVCAVGVEAAGKGFVAFVDRFCQGAVENAQPVAVRQNFVLCIHYRDRVF